MVYLEMTLAQKIRLCTEMTLSGTAKSFNRCIPLFTLVLVLVYTPTLYCITQIKQCVYIIIVMWRRILKLLKVPVRNVVENKSVND